MTKCATKLLLNDRLWDDITMILTYITMTLDVTILCVMQLTFCYIVKFNYYWYYRILVLMPHFLQCCLLYYFFIMIFEFIKWDMFLFSISLHKIQIKIGCKKNQPSSNSLRIALCVRWKKLFLQFIMFLLVITTYF